ncbi:MOSC domain-containing protein [Mesobaculum littorinae]|uniref:MOSC domain-containing protein n=1 Tax=Mesobaculum littorinae TaxID=2486419 RepID=A0A438AIQ0_9RHOB|nr:MOSC domain-containing protein [Mesobaculum littorinae]RVV98505.1 MOSC domain-containing protein [Mesobaculum littorinae]
MPTLVDTGLAARITWLGTVPNRDRAPIDGVALDEMTLGWEGYAAEVHAGLTRPSCSRVKNLYPRGTEIRNTRQLSILSAEELAGIAADLDLDAIDPRWLGASVVVEGLRDFTHLPPSSRLQSEDGTTLTVDLLNGPCQFPAMSIEEAHPGHGKAFKRVAEGRRGVVAWVERPGRLRIGDALRLFVPEQRAWTGQAAPVMAE